MKQYRSDPHKKPGVQEMMGQGSSPAITMPDMSVAGLMKQGKAKKHPNQGNRSVKSLMQQ